MKKIAYMTFFIKNQASRTQYQRAKRLSMRNKLFLFLREKSEIPQEIEKRLTVIRFKNFFSKFTILYLFWRLYKVLSFNKKINFDMVYTFYQPYSIIEGFILKLLGFKWVQDIWDHPELPLISHKIRTSLMLPIIRKALKFADLIICSIHPDALKPYGITPEKVLRITNGVDLDIIQECLKNIKVFNKKEYLVLYVGDVKKYVCIDAAIEAVGIIINRYRLPLKLVIVGRVSRDVKDRFECLPYVIFTGEVKHNEALRYIYTADICICPFKRLREVDYIYPIKIFEYMAMGKVVISTDLKGVSQIIRSGMNGILIEPNDPEQIARAIYSVLLNPKLRRRLEHNAKKTAVRYDWARIHQKINDALYSIK